MNKRTSRPKIDPLLCTGCGSCIDACFPQVLALEGEKAVAVRQDDCFGCGHCYGICPTEAISIEGEQVGLRFETFEQDTHLLPCGSGDIPQLIRLMRSRRSCRAYTEQPVDKKALRDLITIGTTAPSGTNSQAWTFTALTSRRAVVEFAEPIAAFYRRTNNLAANRPLRSGLKLLGFPQLHRYFNENHESVAAALKEWDALGRDRLFFGAPALILVGSTKDASCPVEDAMLATQNILLAAHTMGFGTCLVGFAVEAMKRDPDIGKKIGIGNEEKTHAVIAIGHPNLHYRRPTERRPVSPRFID